ncbi:MAG: DUF5367 family protein [Bacteroidota bacterium]
MKTFRAIGIGVAIWVLGVSAYTLSFFVPVLTDPEQQANMVLFTVVLPLVWFGAKRYYKKEQYTHGYWVGQTFFLTATALDAFITVPVFVLPKGGSYYAFFTDIGFWIIGLEFITTSVLYWYAKVYTQKLKRTN